MSMMKSLIFVLSILATTCLPPTLVHSFIITPSCTRINNLKTLQRSSPKNHNGIPRSTTTITTTLQNSPDNNNNNSDPSSPSTVWNPNARKIMGGIATAGAIETGYLSYVKLALGKEGLNALCKATENQGSSGMGCGGVLDSPYASIGGIPLTVFGFAMYSLVAFLSIYPLLVSTNNSVEEDDSLNRVMLVSSATLMATFSTCLMSILLFVLKTKCTYCIISAGLSLSLGTIAWFSGAASDSSEDGSDNTGDSSAAAVSGKQMVASGLASVLAAVGITVGLVSNVNDASYYDVYAQQPSSLPSSTVMASSLLPGLGGGGGGIGEPPVTTEVVKQLSSPPAITTTSSKEALTLASDLKDMDARFFGAFWCSHCYDQKQTLGKEAMAYIPYVECDKEGKDSQNKLCKANKIPGYPTWEINGELFPGEQSIEELQDVVKEIKGKLSTK